MGRESRQNRLDMRTAVMCTLFTFVARHLGEPATDC
jgi:hypothetical protein